jgi:hypothetical protein
VARIAATMTSTIAAARNASAAKMRFSAMM